MTPRLKGPMGSVAGIPEPEVTAMLAKVIKRLAKEGLEYTRYRAREILEDEGLEGAALDGFLFSLQRTIPGLVNTGFGTYKLPEDWQIASEHRLWRFRPIGLNVLDGRELVAILEAQDTLTPGLTKTLMRLRKELESIGAL